jgi:hypothetical protein
VASLAVFSGSVCRRVRRAPGSVLCVEGVGDGPGDLGMGPERKVPLYLLQVVSRENKRDVGHRVSPTHAGCQPETLGMKRVGLGGHHRLLQAVPREGRRYETKGK